MSSLDRLTKHFERFPGIGPRQARRFVYHLLTENPDEISSLADSIASIKDNVATCAHCYRFYAKNGHNEYCDICSNPGREYEYLMVVERDSDILSIERSGTYNGFYFVLGGTVPLLDSEDAKKLRGGALKELVKKSAEKGLKEIVLAFSVNPDGENTARYVMSLLKDLTEPEDITVTVLGRGLSTGSELEYADPETIKNAFRNRA